MTLFLRTAQMMAVSTLRSKIIDLSKPLAETFRVLPIDLDQNLHMNNAVFLNYMEAMRWAFSVRTGILSLAVKNGWFAPIARQEVQYFRPLKVFQPFTVSAQIVRVEEKWFYFYHEIVSHGKLACRALVRSAIKHKRETIAPLQALGSLGIDAKSATPPADVVSWLESFSK